MGGPGQASSRDDGTSALFVALYDFHGVGDEQLSLKKGDQVSGIIIDFCSL